MNALDKEMNKIEDSYLIQKIKNGDTDCLDLLVRKYTGLVRSMVRKSFLVGGEEEDLFQEGLMAIINAVKLYDQTKNRSFSSFVTTCIKSRIIDTIRTATRFKHKPLNDASSFSITNETEIMSSTPYHIIDPLDTYLEKEWRDNFHKNLKDMLTKQQTEILELYFKGYSYREIAEKTALPLKKIDNTLLAIKNKIRKEQNKFI